MPLSDSKFDVLCAGLVVADFVGAPVAALPASGGIVTTPRIELTIGGSAANVAVDVAKLDLRVGIAARIGDDWLGQFVRDSLQRERVQCDHLEVASTAQTASTLIVNVQGEDRRFIHAVGANAEFTGESLTHEVLRECRILCVGGFGLNPKLSGANVRRAFRSARELGVVTVLDVVISDTPSAWEMLQEVLPETDVR